MDLRKLRVTALAAILLTAWACAADRKLPEGVDSEKRHWYGEFYNLDEYAKCRAKVLRNDMACEYLRLTREEEPEYWPNPNVRKPKLPEPPNPPVYRPGMTSKEYFDALCKAEAGEFIYKVVENVDGIYQIRPRKTASTNALNDRYVIEDPYGYTEQEARNPQFMFLALYAYFETKKSRLLDPLERKDFHPSWFSYSSSDTEFERFSGYDRKTYKATVKELVRSPDSKYGYLWRGISRPQDRELAIAGGELIVVDLGTSEVLGIRRGFARTGFAQGSRGPINWETAEVCPRLRSSPDGRDKGINFSRWFVSKVLKPIESTGKK